MSFGSEEDFRFGKSQMNSVTQIGGTQSGALEAFKVCCHCRCCTVWTVSSCNKTLPPRLLKSGRGLLDHGSPVRSVSGIFLEFLWLDLAPVQTGFDAVLVGLLRSTRVPFAMRKFLIQQASVMRLLLHAMPCPTILSWAIMRIDSILADPTRSRISRLVS